MAKGLFESENKSSPRIEPTEIPSGVTYVARFIMAGPVGYQDGVYFLSQCALDDFAWTMKGKPVLMGPTSGDFPDPGMDHASIALAGRFFTTSTIWEAPKFYVSLVFGRNKLCLVMRGI